MSFRTRLSILSSVLVVLIATYVVGTVFSPHARRARAANQPVVADFDVQEVGEIELLSQGDPADGRTVTIRRDGEGEWSVQLDGAFFPARESRVTALLDTLRGLRTVRTVTNNPDLYGDFEIGEGTADRVSVTSLDGDVLATAYFGKPAVQGDRTYARSAEDPRVYTTQAGMTFYFRQQAEYFAELLALPRALTGGEVQRISIDADIEVGEPAEEGGAPERRVARFTVFRNENDRWHFDETFTPPADAEVDQDAVRRWAANIVDFEGSSFAATEDEEQHDAFGLENPAMEITFSTGSGREYALRVGNRAAEEQFFVQATGPDVPADENGEPYLLTASTVGLRRIFRAPDDLFVVPQQE
ncbi:MAG: DUF4340 domain-containing protein [bacterium]